MATRDHRIAEFNAGKPTEHVLVELLCEDHNGTYKLPFACTLVGERWINTSSKKQLEVTVLGWRPWMRADI